ncbi:hypothetical protein [Polynucleobacter sp.]
MSHPIATEADLLSTSSDISSAVLAEPRSNDSIKKQSQITYQATP